jgi:hypothetical protein
VFCDLWAADATLNPTAALVTGTGSATVTATAGYFTCALTPAMVIPQAGSSGALASYAVVLRVTAVATTAKTIPYAVTHDGRTLRYPDPLIKTHDTVKVDLATGKATEFLKFEVGNTVMITKGRNTGRIGTLVSREKHEGSFDIVQVKDASGATFATRLANAFVIGKGADAKEALISLPKGKGIKTTIFEDRDKKLGKAQ